MQLIYFLFLWFLETFKYITYLSLESQRVWDRLEKLVRDFLREAVGDGKRDYLVRLAVAPCLLEKSGVGTGNLDKRKRLLGKLLWRFLLELPLGCFHHNIINTESVVKRMSRCPWKDITAY